MIDVSQGTDLMQETFLKQREKAFSLRSTGIGLRINALKNLEKFILSDMQELQNAVNMDFGKSPEETAISEIYPVLSEIREARRHLKYWTRPKRVRNSLPFWFTRSYIQYEPKGVCLIISPWNYPFNLAIGPLVSAIAAGNTAILKPSELTPNTSEFIRKMIDKVFPEDWVRVFEGDQEIATRLLSFPFDHIFFTGSPNVGKIVMEAASKNLTSVTLELGGKSPAIIDKSAKLDDAAEKIAWGKWLNAGQTCVAPDYLLIHESVKSAFISRLKKKISKLYPVPESFTSIVNRNHFDRLNQWLNEAVEKGAKIEFGPNLDQESRRMGPTLISEVEGDTHLLREEIFGPVLPLITYTKLSEAIDYVNQHGKPLSLYVFSRKRSVIKEVSLSTTAGSMCINDCVLQFGHPELPFGGVNSSGFGKSHGHHGFLAFSNEKSVVSQRRGMTVAKILYPPFNGFKQLVLKILVRYF